MSAARERELRTWLRDAAGVDGRLEPLAGDASFRRYLRLRAGGDTFVVMDAPPVREDSRPFVHVARLLRQAGVNVPPIHAADLERGFLLLGDLGDDLYLDRLDETSAPALYRDALATLIRMQRGIPGHAVPPFDESELMRELELFPEWYLGRHLGEPPSRAERRLLDDAFATLVDAALAQPRVFVHRDYHSRNPVVHRDNPGVLDFQDAVAGPLAYDVASLFRDAYIAWPSARVRGWVDEYVDLALGAGLIPAGASSDAVRGAFHRDFDLAGLQRHIKIAGIFARLCYRDGKAVYLEDIPLVLGYLLEVVGRYQELEPLARLVDGRALSRFARPLPCER